MTPTSLSNSEPRAQPLAFLQPAGAWVPIASFVFLTIVMLFTGAGGAKVLTYFFPAVAMLISLWLYQRYPVMHISFVWWLCFLSPLVRRVADFRTGGFTDPNPILLAPFLATLVISQGLIRHLPRSHRLGTMPFVLAIAGVVYGYLVGVATQGFTAATVGLLVWLCPILLGYQLFVNWQNFPAYRQNLLTTFAWGALVSGAYGVYQYIVAPEWEQIWLIGSGMTSSAGSPEPYGIRVWSTMNSPGPFAIVMMASMLLLFAHRGKVLVPAAVFGTLSFLLCLVRAAWIGWVLGLVNISAVMTTRLKLRLLATLLALSVCAIPAVTMEPFAGVIGKRLDTLANVQEDGSVRERSRLYEKKMEPALLSFIGVGLGGPKYDSALFVFLFQLGWVGTLPYLAGMGMILLTVFRSPLMSQDMFAAAARAIALSVSVTLVAGAGMIELAGMVLWGFLGISLAAHRYYLHQKNSITRSP
ncbi:MAG: O-antigen ligase domain-containing protein [Oscillatoriales cyanobacterium SM2_2_1]|nr:O-antigen ligase domain-containing protein [Oscillatoriales cyanobacterium SM2_2_1]